MTLIAHLSDTHLGYRQYNLTERERDFYEAFNEAIDKIISERVEIVIHSGDLFDSSRPSTEALLTVLRAVKKLHEKGIKIYTIPGSHDQPKRKGLPPHALFEQLGVRVLRASNPYDVYDNIIICGVQYVPGAFKPVILKKLSELARVAEKYSKRILVLHQAIYQFLPFDYELTLEDLPKLFHYYALGHIHKRILQNFGEGVLAYSGSTEIWSRDEYKEYQRNGKGFYLVDLSRDIPHVHKVDLESIRPHMEFEIDLDRISLKTHLAEILSKLARFTSPKKPIVHLNVRGTNINRQELQRYVSRHLSPRALAIRWNIEEKSLGVLEGDFERSSNISIKQLLKEALEDDTKASFAYELFSLLAKGDVEEAKELAKKFFEEGT
ncbi:MAG: hypothetical protein DRJ51_03060 [Thermoprotei archaeon]|nr:MAG: hypothetical protein DRJ51_03060 [Thermoprotei archaeon]RLE82140.1 MAG: hypothetical protein DRJ36_00790 [Thermoprotei archaeon]RLF02689.1 MAG: hypothetical protein DRJ59_02920 [Thermoprotei archaeon]